MTRAMRFPIWAFVLTLLILLAGKASAQSGVVLRLESEGGDLLFNVKDRISRSPDTGRIELRGQVNITQRSDLRLRAEEVDLIPAPAEQGSGQVQSLDQLSALELRRDVRVESPEVEIEAQDLSFTEELSRFRASGTPAAVRSQDQIMRANGGLYGDLAGQTFHGFGGVVLETNLFEAKAEDLQIILPNEDTEPAPRLLAVGNVEIRGEDFQIRAGYVESSEDGQRLIIGGGVQGTSPEGRIAAGTVELNLETRAFEFDQALKPRPGFQEFLSP